MVGVSGWGVAGSPVDPVPVPVVAAPPDCCSRSHLFQMESFFSGTMMIGPVAPMICVGACSSPRLPLLLQGCQVLNFRCQFNPNQYIKKGIFFNNLVVNI